LIEASTDLRQWTSVTTIMNITGRVELTDPDRNLFSHRFYRATMSE
jgi:hypothetical protein